MDHVLILRNALIGRANRAKRIDLHSRTTPSPRWPSGISRLDIKTEGGFYGFSVLASAPKVGKTLLALRSSVLAADAGWRVIYWTGENTPDILKKRISNVWERDETQWPEAMNFWTAMRYEPTTNLEDLVDETLELIDDDPKVLIVLDSINRLAKYLASQSDRNDNYFRSLERVVSLCQQSSERSGGTIGWLVLSEMNRRGAAIGLDIEYSAACILSMKRNPKRGDDWVNLAVESRESAGGGLGAFQRVYHRTAFRSESDIQDEEQPLLGLIQGGKPAQKRSIL